MDINKILKQAYAEISDLKQENRKLENLLEFALEQVFHAQARISEEELIFDEFKKSWFEHHET